MTALRRLRPGRANQPAGCEGGSGYLIQDALDQSKGTKRKPLPSRAM